MWGRIAAFLGVFVSAANAADPCFYEPNFRADEFYRQGDYRQAANLSRSIITELTATGISDCRLAVALTDLAAAHHQLGEFIEADRELRHAIRIWERMGPQGEAGLLRVRNNLLSLYVESGQFDRADHLMHQILAMPRVRLSLDPMDHAHLLNNLASVRRTMRKYAEAKSLYAEAIAVLELSAAASEPEMGYILNNLAQLLIQMREYQRAEGYAARALSILEDRFGSEHFQLIKPLMNSAQAVMMQKRTQEAEVILARAICISEKALGSDHRQTGDALLAYAEVLRRLDRQEEAKFMRTRAEEILAAHQRNTRALMNTIDASELSAPRR